jgi:hypothetical protein
MRRYCLRLALLSLTALGPVAVYGDDQQIAQQIVEKLQAEKKAGTLKAFSIDLQVDEGTVWLSGRVSSEQQQARALDLARRVPGVKQVVNDLTVNAAAAKPAVAAKPLVSLPSFVPMQHTNSPAAPAHAAPAPAVTATLPSISIPATPIEPISHSASPAEVELPPTPAAPAAAVTVEARPIVVEAKPVVEAMPRVEEFIPVPALQPIAMPVAEQVAPNPQPAKKLAQPQHAVAQNSMLNNVSKTLMSAVHGKSNADDQNSGRLQMASATQDVAKAIGSAPIGSGVVQTAQPIANMPQSVLAGSPQPLPGGFPPQPLPGGYPPQMAMMPMGMPYMVPVYGPQPQVPLAVAPASSMGQVSGPGGPGGPVGGPGGMAGGPQPMYMPGSGVGIAPARYDHPNMPGYAWPSYAACPNYAAVTYPKQYSPTAWPYIGPFYPYPQVPLGWRKVTMEWDDGWWFLDFKDRRTMYNH